jgi:hypothetical protein
LIALFALLPIRPSNRPIRPFMYRYIYTTYEPLKTPTQSGTRTVVYVLIPRLVVMAHYFPDRPKGKKNGKTLTCFQKRPNTNVTLYPLLANSLYLKNPLI